MDNIISKIQKLLALAAEGSGATEAEARNAAIAAQRLINKHQLDMAEIIAAAEAKGEAPVQQEPIEQQEYAKGKRIAAWEAMLGFILAPAFSCRSYTARGWDSSSLMAVGRPTNIAAFKATFDYLVATIERLAKASKPGHIHGREWNSSFGIGACEGIRERIQQESRQIEAANPNMAIVLRNEKQAVDEYVNANLKLRSGPRRNFSHSGRNAGRSAAAGLNLGSVPGRTQNTALRLGA